MALATCPTASITALHSKAQTHFLSSCLESALDCWRHIVHTVHIIYFRRLLAYTTFSLLFITCSRKFGCWLLHCVKAVLADAAMHDAYVY